MEQTTFERQLVTVKPITELRVIPEADAIECAIVDGGWPCVVKKGEFKVGDMGVYFEIDSFVPTTDPRFAFLEKNAKRWEKEPGNIIEGARIKTIKLRGQLSQGLLLPTAEFVNEIDFQERNPEHDLAYLLGVHKWEKAIPANLRGRVRGSFPLFIKKTDQERAQNLSRTIFEKMAGLRYEITTKLDGSSMTVYHRAIQETVDITAVGEMFRTEAPSLVEVKRGICSRNLDLELSDEGNSFISTALRMELLSKLEQLGWSIALQGELMGPGIQGNREGLKETQFFLFDIFDIERFRYVNPEERRRIATMLDIPHVPVLATDASLEDLGITNMEQLLEFADGPSLAHPMREGLVFKATDIEFSFKTISNRFLLKEKD